MLSSRNLQMNAAAAVVTLLAVSACAPRDPNWRAARQAAEQAAAAQRNIPGSVQQGEASPESAPRPFEQLEGYWRLTDTELTESIERDSSPTGGNLRQLMVVNISADGKGYFYGPSENGFAWSYEINVEKRGEEFFGVMVRQNSSNPEVRIELNGGAGVIVHTLTQYGRPDPENPEQMIVRMIPTRNYLSQMTPTEIAELPPIEVASEVEVPNPESTANPAQQPVESVETQTSE
jgi:hypothetical protein